jgi:hypothetical protein
MQRLNKSYEWICRRIPARRELREVFDVVLFSVFGWSIRGFLYKIPAFTLYFGLKTNLAILCYMLAFALLESLLVTAALMAIGTLLPSRFLKEGFAYKSFLIILVASVALILFQGYYHITFFKDILAGDYSSIPPFVAGFVLSATFLISLFWVCRQQPRFQKYLLSLVEQFGVFAYFYVPLGLIGLIVVIIRNLP